MVKAGMPPMEAILSATKSAAELLGVEAELGTLESGKLADVVVLSNDILNVKASEIPKTNVLYTIVGGKVVYRRK